MGWNPANWQITDLIQGQEGSGGMLGNNLSSIGANTPNSATNILSNSQQTQTGGTAVLGSAADNSGMGYMYYDPAQGKFVSSNSSQDPTYNSNPTSSQFDGSGNRVSAPVDPYAQWGGQAAYDSQVNEINTGKSNALNSATASQDASLRGGRSNILDFIGGAQSKQQGIDQSRANAQFSLQEGKGDIMDMVGRGVRSGGVMLANKNAGSSGAAGQIARAYGELGNREARDVGNQFALENQGIDLQQNELNTGFDTQKRKIDEFKVGQAEEIAGTARNALAALEATRMGASLPQLFAIDQEVQAIKDATMAKLGELDSLLQTERGKINPAGQQQTMAKANEMRTAGTGGPQMFNFNTNAAQMQNAGPSVAGAELPIYSNMALNRRREV